MRVFSSIVEPQNRGEKNARRLSQCADMIYLSQGASDDASETESKEYESNGRSNVQAEGRVPGRVI